jgi:hypothetical protein
MARPSPVRYWPPIRGVAKQMTAHLVSRARVWSKSRGLLLPLALLVLLLGAAGSFVSYVLWPTWLAPAQLDAPAVPITVAGVIFNVPPGAIRTAVQRQPGSHERIDLVFLWPSLGPPPADDAAAAKPVVAGEGGGVAAPIGDDRLFVTIAGLGAVLPPAERLRTIYPRYIETQASAGPDGLAIVSFRAGTPYEGEDLVYLADQPEQFFARCTREGRAVPGTCIHERSLEAAEITLRFPRQWLQDWRSVAAGFDRLVAELHPEAEDRRRTTDGK